MNPAVIATLAGCVVFAAVGPYLGRALPPAAAVRLLVPASLLCAGCAVFVVATVTFTLVGQFGEIAEAGRWSPHVLHVLDPIPAPLAVIAGVALAAATAWTIRNVWHTGRALRTANRLGHALEGGSPLVVVDDTTPDAFTTPGLHARTIVTTGMLAALDPAGRRVLLAHEQSHRTHRHNWWVLAAELAAAVNPLLRTTAAAVRDATERWADEDAARVTDRHLVAVTIAHVALLGTTPPATATTLAATGGRVPRRVAALLHPAPRLRARHLAMLVAVTLTVMVGALVVEHTGEDLFEQARNAAMATAASLTPTH